MSVEIDTPEGPVQIAPPLPMQTARTLRDMARAARAGLRARAHDDWNPEDDRDALTTIRALRAVRALRAAFPRVPRW